MGKRMDKGEGVPQPHKGLLLVLIILVLHSFLYCKGSDIPFLSSMVTDEI